MNPGRKDSMCETGIQASGPGVLSPTVKSVGTDICLERLCPLCQSTNQKLVRGGTLRSLVKCRGCGVAYFHPLPSALEIASFFRDNYIASEKDVEVRFGTKPEASFHRIARFIKTWKAEGRILDIGCAGGHFLEGFFRKPDWESWGVELSKFAAAKAIEKGIRVHMGDIHSAGLPRECFDVVTALDTFYYFMKPECELETIRKILKPKGMLVLSLICANSHIWRNTGWVNKLLGGKGTSLFDSHHVYFYDPNSVTSLLHKSGFKARAIIPLPAIDQGSFSRNALYKGYFTVSNLAWRLSAARLMLGPRFLVAATVEPN